MTMVEAVRSMYRNYANFEGRAPRSAFWWCLVAFLLAETVLLLPIMIGAAMTDQPGQGLGIVAMISIGLLFLLVIGTMVPYLALLVRRIHDLDKPGWFLLIYFVPFVGPIVIIVFLARRGTDGPNRFGPDPLAPANVF